MTTKSRSTTSSWKATATALSQHPEVNAHWLGDHIRYHNRVHLGMAVATADGLIVPVIFDADTKRMSQIAAESEGARPKKARERKLTPAEYTGSTFSVSNLGMIARSSSSNGDHQSARMRNPRDRRDRGQGDRRGGRRLDADAQAPPCDDELRPPCDRRSGGRAIPADAAPHDRKSAYAGLLERFCSPIENLILNWPHST